ncbi:MAG: DUF4136 domain-containing protein [Sphingomonadaceae bacterium]
MKVQKMSGVANRRKAGVRAATAAAMLLLMAGCATPFQARVEHYQALPPIQGQTFHVVSADPARQNTLEFQTYAQVVSDRLRAAGFTPASSAENAQFLAEIDYGTGPVRERLATRNVSVGMGWGYGGWYGRSRWGWGGFYDPFWNTPDVYSYPVYPAWLRMQIVRAEDKVSVFEGKAETTTRTDNLTVTLPKLADALFQNFPGERVQSEVVKVPAPK